MFANHGGPTRPSATSAAAALDAPRQPATIALAPTRANWKKPLIWYSLLGVVALILLYGAVQSLRAGIALSWPHVPGRITHNEVHELGEDTDNFARQFKYTYTVNGRDYTGDRVHLWGDLTTSAYASWLTVPVAHFTAGSTVNVFYNPRSPAQSMLSKVDLVGQRAHVALFWGLFFGIACLLLATVPSRWQAKLQAPDLSKLIPHIPRDGVFKILLDLTAAWLLWRLLLPLRMALLFRRVSGEVIVSRVAFTQSKQGTSDTGRANYQPHVEYAYTVGKTLYQGDRLAWDPATLSFGKEKSAKRAQAQWQVGKSVEVFVHRFDPATSVVDGRLYSLHLAVPAMFLAILGGLLWLTK